MRNRSCPVIAPFVDTEAQKEWYRDPEHPGGIVETECDAWVGGLWTSAWGSGEDELYRETCEFRVVDRPRRLVMTCTATAPDGANLETEVEVTFEEEGGRTRMTVIQGGVPDPRTTGHYRGRLARRPRAARTLGPCADPEVGRRVWRVMSAVAASRAEYLR